MGIMEEELRRLDAQWIYDKTNRIKGFIEEMREAWDRLSTMISYYDGKGDTESVVELEGKRTVLKTAINNLATYCNGG